MSPCADGFTWLLGVILPDLVWKIVVLSVLAAIARLDPRHVPRRPRPSRLNRENNLTTGDDLEDAR